MTDKMTAEQALRQARHKFDLCGASFEYEVIRQALTAPRVPERKLLTPLLGLYESARCLGVAQEKDDADAITHWEQTAESNIAAIKELLAAAPAPADVTLTNEGDMVQVADSAAGLEPFDLGQFIDYVWCLRERVKVLEEAVSARDERESTAKELDKLASDMAFIGSYEQAAFYREKAARLRGGSDE